VAHGQVCLHDSIFSPTSLDRCSEFVHLSSVGWKVGPAGENNSKKLNKFIPSRPVLWAATLYLPSATSDHVTVVASSGDVILK
jgi:hypothetical protein